MNNLLLGLLAYGLFYTVFLVICALVVQALPESFLGRKAMTTLGWLPPFIRGEALRDWTATTTEQMAQQRLAGPQSAGEVIQLAADLEEGAMRAMLPFTDSAELTRVIACPEAGQGLVGVTAPEAIAIARYIRSHLKWAEQKRILELAIENTRKMASNSPAENDPLALRCPLQGSDCVCCVYAVRPLRCRPLHALAIARATSNGRAVSNAEPGEPIEGCRHIYAVADGVEAGLTGAMRSAQLSADVYELNSALANLLPLPDAAERWVRGEDVFAGCTPVANAVRISAQSSHPSDAVPIADKSAMTA
jgi:hypothetical protein